MVMKIGILGSGMVGDSLRAGFEKYGYQTKQGSRKEFADIASWADLIVLAVKGSVAEAARAIEPLCMLWCIPGFKDNQWSHAFKLLKK